MHPQFLIANPALGGLRITDNEAWNLQDTENDLTFLFLCVRVDYFSSINCSFTSVVRKKEKKILGMNFNIKCNAHYKKNYLFYYFVQFSNLNHEKISQKMS